MDPGSCDVGGQAIKKAFTGSEGVWTEELSEEIPDDFFVRVLDESLPEELVRHAQRYSSKGRLVMQVFVKSMPIQIP